MIEQLETMLFRLPSMQSFVEKLIDDLISGCSVLALLPPDWGSTKVWDLVQANLDQRELSFAVLSPEDKPSGQSPTGWLGDALPIEWPALETQRSIQNLLATGQLPEVVLLQNWNHLNGPSTLAWVQYMQDWARTVQTAAADDDSAPALCAIVPARQVICHLPESESGLHVYWGMGLPSALEVQLLCRSLGNSVQHQRRVMWREHVLPALIGNDWTLAGPLWQVVHRDVPALLDCLKAEARSRDWDSDTLQEWGAVKDLTAAYGRHERLIANAPPPAYRMLWAEGALGWTLEYGFELHPAALAALGHLDELHYRLWRGQNRLFMPLLDRVRLDICHILTERHGPDWPWPLTPGIFVTDDELNAVRRSPLACQWGMLLAAIQRDGLLPTGSELYRSVHKLRQWRNKIAHGTPLQYSDYEVIWHIASQIPILHDQI